MTQQLHFGPIAEAYDKGRQPLPREVIDYTLSLIGQYATTLDLACGTGIVTRQLAERGIPICGADADERMLAIASTYQVTSIMYSKATAESMPYANETFDAVTMFRAFHWFCTNAAALEIQRVLKKRGTVLAVNLNTKYRSNERTRHEQIIEEIIGQPIPNAIKKQHVQYRPIAVLEEAGFIGLTEHVVAVQAKYTVEERLLEVKSRAMYSFVPPEHEVRVIERIREDITSRSVNGWIEEERRFRIISGTKSL